MSLPLELVLTIHQDQIESYGGEPGVRDLAGLESALAQAELEVFGQVLHPTTEAKAAALLFHLVRNHPFVDGNKRVAWAVMETYLLVCGFALTISNDDAYTLTVDVAKGKLDKDEIAAILKAYLTPA